MNSVWRDPVAPIQRALYARMSADDELLAMVKGVFDYVPEEKVYPYVTVGEAVASPDNTHDSYGASTLAGLHVWSDYRGFIEANAIAGRIVSLFDHQALDLAGHRTIAVRWQQTQPVKDPDPRIRHGIVRLQVVTEQMKE